MTLGERISELRNKRKLTQKDVAKALNLTEQVYQTYENDRGTPSYDSLLTLADYFGVSIDYLASRTDAPEVKPSAAYHAYPFGERVTKLRIAKGLTKREVYMGIGMSGSGYRRCEIPNSKPSYSTLYAMAEYFQVSMDYLTGRTDEPEINFKALHEDIEEIQILRIKKKLQGTKPEILNEVENYLNYLIEQNKKQSRLTAESK